MYLLKNISQIITLDNAHTKDGRNIVPDDLGVKENQSILVDDEYVIKWIGNYEQCPVKKENLKSIDLSGYVLTPEIVDSHTHLVFGGNRAHEYTMRLNGADYQAIANSGGGIKNTMQSTRNIDENELFNLAGERINHMSSFGIGTIEIKSGYGLDFNSEYKLCKIINNLKNKFSKKNVQIFRTYMAAHALPPEFDSTSTYIKDVVIPLMHKLQKESLIDCVDIFHEKGYFNDDDCKILFKEAQKLNLNIKSHADEFNDNKGAILACEHHALSTDHLMCTEVDGIDRLSKSDTVATLLPGTSLFLGKPFAKASEFLNSGCKVAIASDFNPGSCHFDNLLMISSIAAPLYKMNIAQLWTAICLNSAHALGYKNQGAIKEGFKARFSLFETSSYSEITYKWGHNLARQHLLNEFFNFTN